MQNDTITDEDRSKAKQCLECFLCNRAREKQKGLALWFVKRVESGFCPACKAYEKVYGRKAHEPVPEIDNVTSE